MRGLNANRSAYRLLCLYLMPQWFNVSMGLSSLKKAPTEGQIQSSVYQYLENLGFFCWVNKTVGIFDPVKKIYRKPKQEGSAKGSPDILGVGLNGRSLGIEVKDEKEYAYIMRHYEMLRDHVHSCKKKIHYQEQILFIERLRREGGVAFFTDGIETTRRELRAAGMINAK